MLELRTTSKDLKMQKSQTTFVKCVGAASKIELK